MKKIISVICCALVLTLSLAACGMSSAPAPGTTALAENGVLVISVNPEIAVEYDKDGTVTGVTARNDDALAIISSCTGLIGKPAQDAVAELVFAIGEAGYFVEEIEGDRRQIVLEIEPGSALPSGTFLDDVIAGIRNAVNSNNWATPLVVEGESDYGISDFFDTDYGEGSDGVTDYDDTDYGPNNDGVTDYTDYGTTNYDDTDYGPNNDGVTDYTDYGTTNYSDSAYGDSAYTAPAAAPAETPAAPPANYGSSDSGYSNYDSDSGYSSYEGES